jgi:hypothetical protein
MNAATAIIFAVIVLFAFSIGLNLGLHGVISGEVKNTLVKNEIVKNELVRQDTSRHLPIPIKVIQTTLEKTDIETDSRLTSPVISTQTVASSPEILATKEPVKIDLYSQKSALSVLNEIYEGQAMLDTIAATSSGIKTGSAKGKG